MHCICLLVAAAAACSCFVLAALPTAAPTALARTYKVHLELRFMIWALGADCETRQGFPRPLSF